MYWKNYIISHIEITSEQLVETDKQNKTKQKWKKGFFFFFFFFFFFHITEEWKKCHDYNV